MIGWAEWRMICVSSPDTPMSTPQAGRRKTLRRATTVPVRRWAERDSLVLGAAAVAFVVIFVILQQSGDSAEAIGLLYVVPIALVALALALAAGLAAAAVALVLSAIWMVTKDPGFDTLKDSGPDTLGFGTHALATVCVGGIAGRFSDRMRFGLERQEGLLDSGLDLARLGDLEPLPTTLVEQAQQLVGAVAVRVTLVDAPTVERGNPSGELLAIPIASRGIEFGTLEVSAGAGRRFNPEERVTLRMLALQAAIAAHNQRLLAGERERVALHSELELTRRNLSDQFRNAGHVLDQHEEERREIGRQLHEQVAQTVAAALIAINLLEGDVADTVIDPSRIESARRCMHDCLGDLRALASSLRPAVLDELGLVPALERICAEEGVRTSQTIALDVDPSVEGLPTGIETSAYRIVEEALKSVDGITDVSASIDEPDDRLRIEIGSSSNGLDEHRMQEQLGTMRARLELLGGVLRICPRVRGGVTVVGEIPMQR